MSDTITIKLGNKYKNPEFTYDEKLFAVKHLYKWRYEDSDDFYSRLFELFLKANYVNTKRLQLCFELEYKMFTQWNLKGDKLFYKFGLIV